MLPCIPHHTSLIAILCVGFVLASVFGLLAQRLRLSPIVGYLLAGVLVGPHTPGFVGDQTLAPQLAEIGVILLMFGVGLHLLERGADAAILAEYALAHSLTEMVMSAPPYRRKSAQTV